jgi:hypothetical protein
MEEEEKEIKRGKEKEGEGDRSSKTKKKSKRSKGKEEEREESGSSSSSFVLSIDVGSTSIRAHLFDESAKIVGASSRQIPLIFPKVVPMSDFDKVDSAWMGGSRSHVDMEGVQTCYEGGSFKS